jgi:hypothetical protein
MPQLNNPFTGGFVDDPLSVFVDELSTAITGLKGNDLAAYNDLEFFSRWVIGYDNPEFRGNSAFLKNVYEHLQYTDEDLLILGPRGSAKSTAVSVTYVTWMIGRNPLIRFVLAFASMDAQGLAFGRQIMHILTNNERYQRVFGSLKPQGRNEKWSDDEFIVQRPTPASGLKDPTVGIVGLGTAVPSKRADQVICDDLVTQDNAYSPILRKKVIAFVYQTLFPIVVPSGRRIILGSRWDPRDLYTHTAQQWRLEIPPPVPIDSRKLTELAVS